MNWGKDKWRSLSSVTFSEKKGINEWKKWGGLDGTKNMPNLRGNLSNKRGKYLKDRGRMKWRIVPIIMFSKKKKEWPVKLMGQIRRQENILSIGR